MMQRNRLVESIYDGGITFKTEFRLWEEGQTCGVYVPSVGLNRESMFEIWRPPQYLPPGEG